MIGCYCIHIEVKGRDLVCPRGQMLLRIIDRHLGSKVRSRQLPKCILWTNMAVSFLRICPSWGVLQFSWQADIWCGDYPSCESGTVMSYFSTSVRVTGVSHFSSLRTARPLTLISLNNCTHRESICKGDVTVGSLDLPFSSVCVCVRAKEKLSFFRLSQ